VPDPNPNLNPNPNPTVPSGIVRCAAPPGVSDEVWAALPFETQTEIFLSMGMEAEANALADAEIAAIGLDREVYLSLPPELRSEILQGEVTERRRRASIDETQAAGAMGISIAGLESTAPTSSSPTASNFLTAIAAVVGATGSESAALGSSSTSAPVTETALAIATGERSENAMFLASLPFELRQDVLLSADETFLASLTPQDQVG
jgi:hypothetical protein